MKIWMRASAAALCLSVPWVALPDAPPTPPDGHKHVVLRRGDPAPSDGVFADEPLAHYDAERLRWLEARMAACEDIATTQANQSSVSSWLTGAAVGGTAMLVVGFFAGKRLAK